MSTKLTPDDVQTLMGLVKEEVLEGHFTEFMPEEVFRAWRSWAAQCYPRLEALKAELSTPAKSCTNCGSNYSYRHVCRECGAEGWE